jgi:hypothetical protein
MTAGLPATSDEQVCVGQPLTVTVPVYVVLGGIVGDLGAMVMVPVAWSLLTANVWVNVDPV